MSSTDLFKETDYLCDNNLVQRICNKEVAPKEKENLLISVLGFYTIGELPKLSDFEFCQEVEEQFEDDEFSNCICSQKICNAHFITYTPNNMKFKIGKNCFENLYGKIKLDEIHFFKPYCLNCKKEKVPNRRTTAGKEGCCSDKCMYIYRKKVDCSSCDQRFWRIHPSHKLCKKCFFNTFYGYRNPNNINI